MTHRQQAKRLIQLYREGSDLTTDQEHVLNDAAAEHCQILDNVVATKFYQDALTENIEALNGINESDLI
jgi:hypothetical protein